nr:DNL-type zinc finger protein-like [Megalopta genalis]
MFTFRHVIRGVNRLAITQEFTSLHRTLLIPRNRCDINFDRKFVSRTQINFCKTDERLKKYLLGQISKKMRLEFTCKKCNHRSSKLISKTAYEQGVVIVRCDNCKNNHLIADNIGWFEELKDVRNIEKFLLKKDKVVTRVMNDVEGYVEITPKSELEMMAQNKKKYLGLGDKLDELEKTIQIDSQDELDEVEQIIEIGPKDK